MYQDGLVLQATPGALCANKVAAGGLAVAQTTFCSSSGRSPQKHPMPDGLIHTRPSATSIWVKTGVTGNLACSPSEVSVSSGPSAAMYTSPATRSSVPPAAIAPPPQERPTRRVGVPARPEQCPPPPTPSTSPFEPH